MAGLMPMRKPVPLFSVREAAKRGITRVYQPNWLGTMDHIQIDVFPDGTFGPWLHVYSPMNQATNGRDPVDVLALPPYVDLDSKCMHAYVGPLPDSDEYRAEAADFAAMVNRTNVTHEGQTDETETTQANDTDANAAGGDGEGN